MHKKVKSVFICQSCGASYPKWNGRCEACMSWNTLTEETASYSKSDKINAIEFVSLKGESCALNRLQTHLQEFDRVCGGGLVPGSVLLIGGDPGIGKSTLLLQVVSEMAHTYPCAYISGEESIDQVRLRAKRLGFQDSSLYLAASTQAQEILKSLESISGLKLVVIDSIQTMSSFFVDSVPGTVTQVRLCTQEFIDFAKKRGVIVILIGHVTKDGTLAGPRVLEHMVDTVLYFENPQDHYYRLLRSTKNRFGPTDELGVFEMTEKGLQEVLNPSTLFLPHHQDPISGSAVFCGVEGTRPLLCEVQALIAPSFLAAPRRTIVGYDLGRLNMILAVLETRCRLPFSSKDVYLNVAGGLKLTETSADLAVAAALISSLTQTPLASDSVFFGEIGLAGEVRPSFYKDLRLKEAQKMGFTKAICAEDNRSSSNGSIKEEPIRYLFHLLPLLGIPLHTKNKHKEFHHERS
ncbi:MAG: DNA repair protein RadA [Proteobacteria bacterium]|nr:DNA repair protein RadA [Pseudomonadota bacterium]